MVMILVSALNIRENITPIGDGNDKLLQATLIERPLIRENITPIGDGNSIPCILQIVLSIRENITPIGDGNCQLLLQYIHYCFF